MKATLCQLLSQYRSREARTAIENALNSPHAIVRDAAVSNLPADDPQELIKAAAPLLNDPVRSVRIAAAIRLLSAPRSLLDKDQQKDLAAAIAEFKEQLHMADERAAAHIQLSQLARSEGNAATGAEELRTAIRLEPYLTGSRSELAQLLLDTASDPAEVAEEVEQLRREEIEMLKRDIALVPGSGEIRYRLGLLYYLVGDLDDAERRLSEASDLEPRSYQFMLGLALLQQEQYNRGETKAFDRAVETLKQLFELDPNSPDAKNIFRAMMQLRQAREAENSDETGSEVGT